MATKYVFCVQGCINGLFNVKEWSLIQKIKGVAQTRECKPLFKEKSVCIICVKVFMIYRIGQTWLKQKYIVSHLFAERDYKYVQYSN